MAASSAHNLLIKNEQRLPQVRAARIPAPVVLLQICYGYDEVRQLHTQLIVSGLIDRPINAARLIESYISLCQVQLALSVFRTVPSPDIFAYNNIMRGFMMSDCPNDSLLLYEKLVSRGVMPNDYTYTFVLKACSRMKALAEGKQVHCQIIKAGIEPGEHIRSSLINMYAKSACMDSAEGVLAEFSEENVLAKNSMISGYMSQGQVEAAREVFDKMTAKDSASWSAMITGYTRNARHADALEFFQEMLACRVLINESILVSVISACTNLHALEQGRWVHEYIKRTGTKISVRLGTSLVDMYAKCGCIRSSYEVFTSMPEKDVIAWGAMISGFAMHGEAGKCFQLFDEMVVKGTRPNGIVFVGILSACSHAGYVQRGDHYFSQMVSLYGIRPSIEHYGCMVDLLGRAGKLAEAEQLILSMSEEEPNPVMWRALLGHCRIHKDLRRGEWAFRQLVKLDPLSDPLSDDRYKLADHLFADAEEQESANRERKFVSGSA